MLYVALTRPTDRLYLVVKKDTFKFEKTVGNQLYRFAECPVIEKGDRFIKIVNKGEYKKVKFKKEENLQHFGL